MTVMTAVASRGKLDIARDYVSLLKLRIVVLLDATAIGVMIPASQGHPRLVPVLAVLVGGTLAAGGAHPVHFRVDRDNDAPLTPARPPPPPGCTNPPPRPRPLGTLPNIA